MSNPPIIFDMRTKCMRSSAVDELVCPITLALPFDPVVAEDGRIYERSAILEHINTVKKQKKRLKSPMTNELMGRRLVTSYPFKSIIEKMIDNGEIDGPLAVTWKTKRANKQQFDELKSKAERGDPEAMHDVGLAYWLGNFDISIDENEAKEWFEKGSDAGCIKCMALHGSFSVHDAENVFDGIASLGVASASGSDYACLQLGEAYAKGMFGLPANRTKAIRLLRNGLGIGYNCMYQHAAEEIHVDCKKILKELETHGKRKRKIMIDDDFSDSDDDLPCRCFE